MSNYRRRLLLANQSEENIILYGNSVQDGTPTPDAPIDIMSVENPTIKVIGKNLFNKEAVEKLSMYIGTDDWWFSSDSSSFRIKCKPNKSYVISGENPSCTIFRAGYTITDDLPIEGIGVKLYNIKQHSSFSQPIIITTGDDAKYLVVQVNAGAWEQNIEKLQIEEGLNVTKFEPYEEEIIIIDETTPFGKNWVADDVYNIDNWAQVGNGYGYYLNLPTGDYTVSAEKKDNSNQFFYLQISTNDWTDFVTKHILLNANNNRVTFTVEENTKCRFYTTNSGFANYIDSIQIEKGKYYTGYEPYVPPITSMRGVGNYKDRIYIKDGKVWFEQRSAWYETDASDTVNYNKSTTVDGISYLQLYINDDTEGLATLSVVEQKAANNPGLCSHFEYKHNAYSGGKGNTAMVTGNTIRRLWFSTDKFVDANEATLWLDENTITAIYPLKNPIITEITGYLAEKILAIDKTKNITIYSNNGIYGNIEIIED